MDKITKFIEEAWQSLNDVCPGVCKLDGEEIAIEELLNEIRPRKRVGFVWSFLNGQFDLNIIIDLKTVSRFFITVWTTDSKDPLTEKLFQKAKVLFNKEGYS